MASVITAIILANVGIATGAAPGDLVRVPLGSRECTAVVWANDATPDPRLDNRLKDVTARLDIPPLKPVLRKFVEWVSGYTLSPRGMVLRMALRMGEHLGPERVRVGIRVAGPPPQRMTAARARVLHLLADGPSLGVRVTDKGKITFVLVARFAGSSNPTPRQGRRCAFG